MDAEQTSLIQSYTNGEDINKAKLRALLKEMTAEDRWSVLKKRSGTLQRAASINDLKTMTDILEEFRVDQIIEMMKAKDGLEEATLHIAARQGHLDIVNFILTSVSDRKLDLIELQTNEGTALHAAVKANRLKVVEVVLLALTEDERYEVLQTQNSRGETVLHTAAFEGHITIMKYILELLPNKVYHLLTVADYVEKNTVLHVAAKESKSETVLQILKFVEPANRKLLLNAKNTKGQTIADLAAPQMYYIDTLRELEKTREEMATLRRDNLRQKQVMNRQAEEFRIVQQEHILLKELHEIQGGIIVEQTAELNLLRNNQTEMLKMISELQISPGMAFSTGDTPNQANENYSDV